MKHLSILFLAVVLSACGKLSNPGSLLGGDSGGGGGDSSGDSAASPGGPVSDFKLSCEEARFVRLLNIYRRSQGSNALAVSKAGVLSTRWHAEDMIDKNYFSHTEPNGRDFMSRASAFNYGAWAENIAAGNASAEGTFCQWKNSPGHNSNMLGGHSTIGIGEAQGGSYGTYWSNNFGGSATDTMAEPLTLEPGCSMPSAIPGC